MVDAAEKTEESQVQTISLELPQGADAAGKTEDAIVNTEVSVLYEGADAAGKTEEAKVNLEVSELPKGADAAGKMEDAEITVVLELPKGADAGEKTEEAEGNADFSVLPSDVSTPVSENQGDGKRAESELSPLEGEKTENGPAIESTGPPLVEKKEEAGSTIINPVKPPAQICPASIQYVSNTSHTPTSSHLLTPPLPDEMIEEIFLCFSPDKAAALVRASLTSKTWIRIISSKRFRRRYVNIHGTPPLLGFFYCWPEYCEPKGEDTVNPFLSISHFNARIPDSEKEIILQYTVLDCRHGRVLAADPYVNPIKFLIWDPMTGRGSSLVAPREYSSQHATVICAVSGCDHLSCNKGNSQVVLVGIDHVVNVGFAASAYVFSTETGKWSEQSAVLDLPSESEATVIQNPPILLDEKLYFAIQYDQDDLEDDEDDVHILMYDLRSHCLSLIDAPQRDSISRNDFILLAMENGNLGFAELGWSSIELWSWQMGPEGAPGWTESTIVEHRNILPMKNRHYGKIEILGSVEGHGIVFLSTDLGIFKFNLNSQKFEKIWKREGFYILFPYFSFYELEDESVLSDLNKNIIQARMVNKLTQAQLAQMINEELQVVEEYEPGKAIPNQQIIGKLKGSLGTKL